MGGGEAVGEFDGEVVEGIWPIRNGLGPFAADVLEAEVEEFEE